MASPLEVLDGCIHALTCIGPASKEMSRHYWREPLVLETLHDEEVDLCGVIFVGSPQINTEKFYVSKRVGMMVKLLMLMAHLLQQKDLVTTTSISQAISNRSV